MQREELYASLWGAAFLLVTGYAWLGVQLARLFARGAHTVAVLSLSEAGLPPGAVRSGELRARIPGRLPPAIRLDYLLSLAWHAERLGALVPLRPGEQRVTLELRARRRGCYIGPPGYLVFEDLFGLARGTRTLPGRRELRVYPELPEVDRIPSSSALDGQSTPRRDRRRESDDLIESRPYVPGDDPRRLNWKHYAHLGELLVRVGEHTPPPRGVVAVFLDTGFGFASHRGWITRSCLFRPSAAARHRAWGWAYCDRLVAQFCAAALELLQGGREARVWWPALDRPKAIGADDYEWLLWEAAAIWWSDGLDLHTGAGATEHLKREPRARVPGRQARTRPTPALTQQAQTRPAPARPAQTSSAQPLVSFAADQAVVVAPVGSPTLAPLLRHVRARCRNVTLRICDWPFDGTAGRPLWSRILFTSPGRDHDTAEEANPVSFEVQPPAAAAWPAAATPSASATRLASSSASSASSPPAAPSPPPEFGKRLESDILSYRQNEWRLRKVVVT